MKIFDILDETTQQETDIASVSNAVADHLVNHLIPHFKSQANRGEGVSSIGDPEIDYYLLSGYPIERGYVGLAEVPENIEKEYYINLGKLTDMISGFNKLDPIVVNVIKKIKMYLMLSTNNVEAEYDPDSDEIYIKLNRIFSSKNVIDEKKVASLVAHEIRHAIDNHVSDGKIFNGDEEKKKSVENSDEDKKFKTYLKLQSEGNARFTQTARDLIDYIESTEDMDVNKFKNMLSELKKTYNLMDTPRKKIYRSFMKRAYKIYDHLMGG